MHAAVVELDALADPVGAAADDHDLLAIAGVSLALFLVGGVHVGGAGGKLGGAGVNPLVHRTNAQLMAQLTQAGLGDAQQLRQAGVGKTLALEPEQRGPVDVRFACLLERLFFPNDVLNLHQEPGIDVGVTEHFVHRQAGTEGITDVPDAVRSGHVQFPGEGLAGVLGIQVLQFLVKALGAHLQATQSFLQRLLESPADGHHLTHGLHLGGQAGVGLGEFLEGEAGNLGDHVVDGRLERGRGDPSGDLVAQLVQGVAHRQLGRHLGNREAGGLGGQRRGAGHPGVHFNHHHAPGVRVDAELHVGTTGLNSDLAQHRQRGVAHDLILLVGQGLGRGHGNGVPGVHAHGVEVLNGADDDAVVVLVPNDLHLVLLPADQGFVDQQLVGGREVQPALADLLKLILVVGNATAGAAHGEGRPDDAREADLLGHFPGLLHGVGDGRARAFQADLLHGLVEPVAVLGLVDGVGVGADHFHPMLGQHAMTLQVQRAVEGGLPPHGRQQGVRFFLFDDFLDRLPGDGFDVGGVRHRRVGHDGGRVGVHQNHPVALFPQRLAGLGPGIVELARLADHDGTGAQDQDAFNVGTFWHVSINLSATLNSGCAKRGARERIPARPPQAERASINRINSSNKGATSWGPGLASGWPWKL